MLYLSIGLTASVVLILVGIIFAAMVILHQRKQREFKPQKARYVI